jgi:hypothetical protein
VTCRLLQRSRIDAVQDFAHCRVRAVWVTVAGDVFLDRRGTDMSLQINSISYIKRRAKFVVRSTGCAHHEALDIISRQAGYQNYAHALNKLAGVGATVYTTNLYQFWYNSEDKARGNEMLSVELSQPLIDLVRPHHLVGYLGGCKFSENVDLVLPSGGYMRDDARYAMRRLQRVARALMFMDVTGLRTSSARRCYPKGKWDNRPPGADHDHSWYHPPTQQYVLTTEPYPGHFAKHEIEAWAMRHGYELLVAKHDSIYGFGTEQWLAATAKAPLNLKKLVERWNQAPNLHCDVE